VGKEYTMTREEAIEVMKAYRNKVINSVSNQLDGDIEALNMAIKALSQVTKVRKLILQAERSGVHLDYGAYKFMNALEKVVGEKQIGEFEQEPCRYWQNDKCNGNAEVCEDAISRDAVRQAIDEIYNCTENMEDYANSLDATIEKLPSVTPSITRYIEKSNFSQEQYLLDTDSAYQIGYVQGKKDSRRKGHWIAKDSFEIEFKCSECEWEGYDTNFCPNCGAKMESEDKK